ncbi:MAG TPA: hypothetical protein VGE98_05190, partial [Thermoanaerobaculia bacterium]
MSWKRRGWTFVAGAGLGLGLAQLAGAMLDGELQGSRTFVPLSTLACGLSALGAATLFFGLPEAAHRRRLWAVLAVLAVAATLPL